MFEWIWENLGTILVSLALAIVVALIILGMRRDKKRGKSSCPGGCAGCSHCGSCPSCPSCSRKAG